MKTALAQAIILLEEQRKSLQEMDLIGVLLENELAHKSNQINIIQILLAKLLPIEKQQIIDAAMLNHPMSKVGLTKEQAEQYYNQTYNQ